MKNLLIIAIALSTVNAFASKAYYSSLGGSIHLADKYSPENFFEGSEYFTIEAGLQTPGTLTALTGLASTANANATTEGQLVKSVGEGRVSVLLGHEDTTIFYNRQNSGVALIQAQQNPLELGYAMKWDGFVVGAGLIYSKYEVKVGTVESESSLGLRLGISNQLFYTAAKLILEDKYSKGATTYKGATGIDLLGGMNFGSTSVHANIVSTGFTVNDGATADSKTNKYSVNAVEKIKKDNNEFFYGAGVVQSVVEDTKLKNKTTTLNLPLIIGLEAVATNWLTLRASVSQDVLLSDSKFESTPVNPLTNTNTSPGLNSTKFAAGAGLTFNKVTIDGLIATAVAGPPAATVQDINTNNLLSSVAVTYNF